MLLLNDDLSPKQIFALFSKYHTSLPKDVVVRPFPQEQEYAEKAARLKELDIMLNMDEKDSIIFDSAPDESDMEPVKANVDRER